MSKKGFTLVELITTFVLSSVIIIILLNVVITIKNVYTKAGIKTDLYVIQSNLSNNLNKVLGRDNIVSYIECYSGIFCYDFTLATGAEIRLVASEDSIKFGDFVYTLDNKAKVINPEIENITIDGVNVGELDSFLVIRIPIISALYPESDFGINLVYMYDSRETYL